MLESIIEAVIHPFKEIGFMLTQPILIMAIIVGALVSLCAALLGVILVLKRYSMIGIGLSNVGFAAMVIAAVLNIDSSMVIAIPLVIAVAFILLNIRENSKIKGDSAVALVSTISLAIGWVIVSQTTGMNSDVCNFLFGSIFTVVITDVYLSIGLSVIVLTLFILFYNKLFAVTFDETSAKTAGIKTNLYNSLVAFLTALTIVLGMRVMGSMLISALIIFPALTAMRLFKKFKSVTICAAIVSVFSFFIGMYVSWDYEIGGGASVVLVNTITFVIFWLIAIFVNSGLINKSRK